MLRQENTTVAKRLVDSLKTTITTSGESVASLKRSFENRPAGNLAEAKTFCKSVRKNVEQLEGEVTTILPLMKAPSGGELIDAATRQMDLVDRVLDMFEGRLKEAYGIEVKACEEVTETEEEVVVDEEVVVTNEEVATPPTPVPTRASPQFEEVMPATPKLEDFGICSADLAALAGEGGVSGTPCDIGRSTGVVIGSGDYVEAVQKSMTELGIETPVQVADKFSARRHIALRGVMIGTTPRVAGGMLDYTELAGGYYEGGKGEVRKGEGRKLDFGEGENGGLRERYESVDGYWKSCCEIEDVMKGAEGVRGMVGGKEEVLKRIGERCEGDPMAVLVGLTKMRVVEVGHANGEAVYRYNG